MIVQFKTDFRHGVHKWKKGELANVWPPLGREWKKRRIVEIIDEEAGNKKPPAPVEEEEE